ncbi:NEQ384 [Nanoarchaeum equitans Kin4-M]|uniref:NEQ384 n=1 Tax=Nanoarchaeum equitans (strain Kin4-M) TaxID=228908 RepID=Q74MD8_NANEQ|nr:NEQ384 [Nanoarchaeum equitans Kin4-M]
MRVIVFFVEPEKVDNIGAMARVCKNFNADLYLINPKVDNYEKAFVVAKHAQDLLQKAIENKLNSIDEAKELVDISVGTTGKIANEYNVLRSPLKPWELAERFANSDIKLGIFIGRESIGLTNEELSKMDFIVTIPANKEYPILNATHATAIILYELFKHSKEGHVNLALPKKEQIDVLLDYVKKIIDKLPQPDYRKEYYFIIMRKLITQGIINSREANTLIGFFRSIYENLK